MVTVALYVRLEAKPGKETDVEAFLKGGLAIVQGEPATTTWFALRLGPSTFGIFDAFPDDSGRQAHRSGRAAAACPDRRADATAARRSSPEKGLLRRGTAPNNLTAPSRSRSRDRSPPDIAMTGS